VSTFWIILANHLKRKSLICSMAVARKGSTIVCFLWNILSCVDIACLEPCSTTSLYPY
jgi:hypothetical protein